ncbi:hypothetical protein N7457_002133 [Penicillium paradoxum]|uniref:uncharacterized protein n=1 Tax=Penicillium paradoxum TaxID=176176 RepID=UPI002547CE88|nr:uncharacterized protein N7457_002133 [Penicillium paradoxum]KAJ5787143.1 hypothetical protein N7457_002133 [Penicillium paradoxum]
MLSSRSYLELSSEGQDKPETSIDTSLPTGLSPEAKDEQERCLRSRTRHAVSKAPGNPDLMPGLRDSVAPDRPVRKRGRPRLERAKDATAIEERRLQIRRAQRTYRLKKEVTIQKLKSRVDVLEQTLENISDLLGATHRNADLLSVDHLARTRELILAEIDKTRITDESDLQPEQTNTLPHDTFGYQVSQTRHTARQKRHELSSHRVSNRARSPSPLINRILPTTTIYTYSHQESSLSRRLQRFCLEHTYRWLTDPHTEPAQLGRVFGLVPCIHDMSGIRRHFRRVLQSEIGSNLEFQKIPFYTLGGAGKHFPRLTADGLPIYPPNTRRPKKILRRMVRIIQRGGIQDWDEDWSGDREPPILTVDGLVDYAQAQMSEEERIRALDLDGEWFDCNDVQGYLQHRGLVLEGSSLRLGVPESLVGSLYGSSPDRSTVSSLYASPDGATPVTAMERMELDSPTSDCYTLDVECFFDLLLANLRILGRAPGFRVWDVDAALRAAISRRPFV